MRERIVVLDGAMGTMIQGYKLSEADYRGDRLRDWQGKDLKGSLELLNLTQPQVIEEIHSELSRGRRGYHRNQHLQRNNHRLERFPVSRRTHKWPQRSGILSACGGRCRSSGDSFMKLILKPRGSRAALRTGPRMKAASSDLLADQWDRFLSRAPFHLT